MGSECTQQPSDLFLNVYINSLFLIVTLMSCFLAKINETDTFGPGDDDEIQFDDIGDDDEDIDDVSKTL